MRPNLHSDGGDIRDARLHCRRMNALQSPHSSNAQRIELPVAAQTPHRGLDILCFVAPALATMVEWLADQKSGHPTWRLPRHDIHLATLLLGQWLSGSALVLIGLGLNVTRTMSARWRGALHYFGYGMLCVPLLLGSPAPMPDAVPLWILIVPVGIVMYCAEPPYERQGLIQYGSYLLVPSIVVMIEIAACYTADLDLASLLMVEAVIFIIAIPILILAGAFSPERLRYAVWTLAIGLFITPFVVGYAALVFALSYATVADTVRELS